MTNYNSGYKSCKIHFLKESFFAVKPEGLNLRDLSLMEDENGGFLICPEYGTSLLLDKDSARDLRDGRLSDSLAFVLVQRGMASYQFSRPVADTGSRILPSFFLIDMTKSCNLNCAYCFRDLDRELPSINKEQLIRITEALIRHMRSHPGMTVSIQAWGGEPLLKLDLIILMRRMFTEAGLHPEITIETNGTLIDSRTAQIISDNEIHTGISIDGNAAVHDRQRPFVGGQPSCSRVEAGIRNLRDAGCKYFGTITVVTKATLEHLEEVIDYFVRDLQLRSVKLNLMRRTGLNRDLGIAPGEIAGYADRLLNCLYRHYKEGIPLMEQNIRQRMLNLTCRPNNNICNSCGCQGGRRMLSIDPEGNVYPCELTDYPDFRLGTIEESFDKMALRAVKKGGGYFEPRRLERCGVCPWIYYCRGGCRTAALYAGGSVANIDETECELNRVMYSRLARILINDEKFAEYLLKG